MASVSSEAGDWQQLAANAKAAVATVLKLSSGQQQQQQQKKKRQLFESKQIYLTVGLRFVPTGVSTVLLSLPNCPHADTDSCCLITKDLVRDPANYEATGAHFTELLRTSGWLRPTTVLPLRELTVAYMPHEARRRLCNSFDYFLADRRVAHRLGNKLGKHFAVKQRRKLPLPVDLEAKNLKSELARGSSTVRLCMSGSTVSCLLGNVEMTPPELEANTAAACQQLGRKLPGGVANINGLYLRHSACGNVPVYAAAASAAANGDSGEREAVAKAVAKAGRAVGSDALLDEQLSMLRNTLWDPKLVRVQSERKVRAAAPKRLGEQQAKGKKLAAKKSAAAKPAVKSKIKSKAKSA